jgi:hypothetical protein
MVLALAGDSLLLVPGVNAAKELKLWDKWGAIFIEYYQVWIFTVIIF